MNPKHIVKIGFLILYITFATFIFVGGGFITNVLFNVKYDPSCVGLDNETKLNIAKMTIVIFWIIFIPLCLLPIAIGLGYELF
jgi:hypothetical protein